VTHPAIASIESKDKANAQKRTITLNRFTDSPRNESLAVGSRRGRIGDETHLYDWKQQEDVEARDTLFAKAMSKIAEKAYTCRIRHSIGEMGTHLTSVTAPDVFLGQERSEFLGVD
jgi:hypothetical protein